MEKNSKERIEAFKAVWESFRQIKVDPNFPDLEALVGNIIDDLGDDIRQMELELND
jgi:hypothetical protein